MLVEVKKTEPGIATVLFNDPPTRNAMSEEMAERFSQVVEELSGDTTLRAVILTGSGEAFSGGGHLEMLLQKTKLSEERNREAMELFYERFLSVEQIPVPTIAAINGHAMGAGLCVALACDIRIAADEAKLGLNFVQIGLHPGMGATYFLPRIVGTARARELLFTGRVLSATDAEKHGLVNEVVPKGKVEERARELATTIAGGGPQAIRALKETLIKTDGASLDECLSYEARAQAKDYIGKQFLEGITAAREKRKPKFI